MGRPSTSTKKSTKGPRPDARVWCSPFTAAETEIIKRAGFKKNISTEKKWPYKKTDKYGGGHGTKTLLGKQDGVAHLKVITYKDRAEINNGYEGVQKKGQSMVGFLVQHLCRHSMETRQQQIKNNNIAKKRIQPLVKSKWPKHMF